MSLADFSEQDLDRLADYLAGALEADDADDVARLVETDPTWAAAAAELTAADDAVRHQLRAYGQAEPIGSMPADIVARIDAALATTAAATQPPEQAGTRTATVVSLDAARRARRRRLAMVTAAASVVIAFGFGVVALNGVGSTTGAGQSDTAAMPQSGSVGAAGASDPYAVPPKAFNSNAQLDPNITVTSSGRNYTAATIASADRLPPSSAPSTKPGAVAAESSAATGSVVPNLDSQEGRTLSRLNQPDQLSSCLAQVISAYPGRVVAVDYAQYEFRPALIVVVQQADGASVVVAVGANCGLGGADVLGVGRP